LRDICLLRYNKIAPVEVAAALIDTYTLKLTGKGGLTYTSRVELNGVNAPDFVVISDRRIDVVTPMGLRDSVITDIVVYVEVSQPDEAVDLDIQLTTDHRSGLLRVSQAFVKLLLTTPGTNIFDVTSGGGLDSLIKRTSLSDTAGISGAVTGAVQRVKKQIMASQTGKYVPAEEQLVDAKINSLNVDITSLSVAMKLQIITRGGYTELAFPLDAGRN